MWVCNKRVQANSAARPGASLVVDIIITTEAAGKNQKTKNGTGSEENPGTCLAGNDVGN